MSDDLTEKIRAILSDPAAAEKISAIASSLAPSGGAAPASPSEEQPLQETVQKAAQSLAPQLPFKTEPDPSLALLNALKPLLREERRDKIDSLTKAMALANMLGGLKKK